jgi:methyl-galactoside transport system substrate-binding protein
MRLSKYIVLLILVVTLSSCDSKESKIPLVIYNGEDPYIASFEDKIIQNAEGLFEIESYDSQNSQLIQNEIIDELIEQNPKVLIINPVDRLGVYTIIEKAKAANIPVIFFNREPLEEDLNVWNYALYVGALDEESAQIQAEMVMELFGSVNELTDLDKNDDNQIQLLILKGEQGHQAAEKRTSEIIRVLENNGYTLDILSIEVCDWNRDIANLFVQEFLPEHPELELVVSNNDAMALGAIDAMIDAEFMVDLNEDGYYEQGVDQWIPVLGIDALEEAIPYLENGSLYGTVLNDSEEMAKVIIELAEAIINGEDPNGISYDIVNNNFVWVPYQRFELEED